MKGGSLHGISSRFRRTPSRKAGTYMERTGKVLSSQTPKNFRTKLIIPPTPNATGKITAEIQRAFFSPLSLIMTKNWAMHGMKRVIVTRLTRI